MLRAQSQHPFIAASHCCTYSHRLQTVLQMRTLMHATSFHPPLAVATGAVGTGVGASCRHFQTIINKTLLQQSSMITSACEAIQPDACHIRPTIRDTVNPPLARSQRARLGRLPRLWAPPRLSAGWPPKPAASAIGLMLAEKDRRDVSEYLQCSLLLCALRHSFVYDC